MKNHIVLSTLGSLGDLYPIIALAEALEARGQETLLVLEAQDAAYARSRGLSAVAFGPTREDIEAETGWTEADIARIVFRDPSVLVNRLVLPRLAEMTRALAPHVEGARAVCATVLAMAAPLAAECAGVPFVPIVLQPMLAPRLEHPPRVLGFSPPMFAQAPHGTKLVWNKAWFRFISAILRRRHLNVFNLIRVALGLKSRAFTPLLEPMSKPFLGLGLWDATFAPKTIGADPEFHVCGFPMPVTPTTLPNDLTTFLDADTPPLVVTMGSTGHSLAGRSFWSRSVSLARSAGLRAVLLSGPEDTPTGTDIFRCDFAPHAALFPRAAAVLHHGGMGTTTAALRAGVPQMIRPLGADQPDNAALVEDLGVGLRLPRNIASAKARDILQNALQLTSHAKAAAGQFATDGCADAAQHLLLSLETYDRRGKRNM